MPQWVSLAVVALLAAGPDAGAPSQAQLESECTGGDRAACRTLAEREVAASDGGIPGPALEAYRQGCALGDADACVSGTAAFVSRFDRGSARELALRGCALGNRGLCAVAEQYARPPTDPALLEKLERGCEQRHALDCHLLAENLSVGAAGPPEWPKIAALYEKACRGGQPYACRDGAALYRAGEKLPQDLAKASALEAEAARLQNAPKRRSHRHHR